MSGIAITVTGLRDLGFDPTQNRKAASMALNKVSRDMRTVIARDIRRQIAFPASYLAPSAGRLYVGLTANPNRLTTKIVARTRPTSLARFMVTGGTARGGRRRVVRVRVKPGRVKAMPRAFPVRLRRGLENTDTAHNLGLAIRLKPGERVRNKREMVRFSASDPTLYLLYGPSVQQAALNVGGTGLFRERAEMAARKLAAEYLRLLNVRGLFKKGGRRYG